MKQRGNAKYVGDEQPIGDQEEIVEGGGNKDSYSKARAAPLLCIFLEESFQSGRECDNASSLPHECFDRFERDLQIGNPVCFAGFQYAVPILSKKFRNEVNCSLKSIIMRSSNRPSLRARSRLKCYSGPI
jgi:hypothetical protein